MTNHVKQLGIVHVCDVLSQGRVIFHILINLLLILNIQYSLWKVLFLISCIIEFLNELSNEVLWVFWWIPASYIVEGVQELLSATEPL